MLFQSIINNILYYISHTAGHVCSLIFTTVAAAAAAAVAAADDDDDADDEGGGGGGDGERLLQ